MSSPRLAVRDIALFERPVRFAKPFRFGAVTVDAAPQAFVRVEIDVEGKGRAVGASAEMMIPKWFDKRPHLALAQTVEELRQSLTVARDLYLASDGLETSFALHAARIGTQMSTCAGRDIPALAAAFGPAEIDKAILDAVLRALGLSFFQGMTCNIAGIDARLTGDLDDGEITSFLDSRQPSSRVAIRHTVGLDDEVEGPNGVGAIARATATHYFKLKLGGNPDSDAVRLAAIGREIDGLGGEMSVTLDANEQYAAFESLADLVRRIEHEKALAPIARRLLYIEQPMPRDLTRQTPLRGLGPIAVIIDEADDSYDAFPAAKALGYRGISSKACKGFYKSVLNATRARAWSSSGETFFITGEDLTCQAGLAVQQDLALGAFLGLTHAERNGHHYVDGFGAAPFHESSAFLKAHPDLYADDGHGVHLAIRDGALSTASLGGPGFASGVHPDWASLAPLHIQHQNTLQET